MCCYDMTVLYCSLLYCTVLYCTYRTYCTVLYCSVLDIYCNNFFYAQILGNHVMIACDILTSKEYFVVNIVQQLCSQLFIIFCVESSQSTNSLEDDNLCSLIVCANFISNSC